jgi:hypothetical protein
VRSREGFAPGAEAIMLGWEGIVLILERGAARKVFGAAAKFSRRFWPTVR